MTTKAQRDKDLQELAPGQGSMLTHIFNGIGNTTMIVGAAVGIRELLRKNQNNSLLLLGTVATVAVGALWGWHESRQVRRFRTALTNEVTSLQDRIEQLEAEKAGWQGKIASKREQESLAEPQL